MSDKIVIENNKLTTEQGSMAKTVITVNDGSFEDVEIVTPNGVGFDFDLETGELSLASNSLGTHEVLIAYLDGEPQVITLEVVEDGVPDAPAQEEPQAPQSTSNEETTQPPVVDAPVEQTPPPVVETVVAPVVVEAPKRTATAPRSMFTEEQIALVANKNTEELARHLKDYAEKMGPKVMVPDQVGAANQQKLFRAIIKVLNMEGKAFSDNMNYLVAFVKQHRDGVFNERYINRFVKHIKLNKDEAVLFSRLTTLLIITADMGKDKKLVPTRVDLKYIGDKLRNDAALNRLSNFYNPATE